MTMQCRLLLLAHAIDHEETVMPLEVGIDVVVGFPLEPLGLERATVRDDALRAGPRCKDFLTPALDHVLLENLGKFLGRRLGSPADRIRTSPPGKGRAGIFSRSHFAFLAGFCLHFSKSFNAGFKGKCVSTNHAPGYHALE